MKKNNQSPQTFEQAMQELDSIVAQMETGELPLDDTLAAYKRGGELVRFCREKLENAQLQIKKLENNDLVDCTNEYE